MMQTRIRKAFKKIGFALAASVAVTAFTSFALPALEVNVAEAQEKKERPTRRTPALSQAFFQDLSEAEEAAEEKNYAEAIEIVNELLNDGKPNSYERAVAYRYLFSFYYEQDNYQQAIRNLELAIQQPDLPYSFEDSLRFALAQLYASTEQFDKAMSTLNTWFQYAENPGPDAYAFKGQLYYQIGLSEDEKGNISAAQRNYREGIPFIEQAIEKENQKEGGGKPRENWYQLLTAMYYNIGNVQKTADLLEFIIIRWPRPQYWSQLGAMYSELEEPEKQLAVLDVAYRLGYLEREGNLYNVAQLYNFYGTPYQAAQVIEKGIEEDKIDPDEQRNMQLLGSAYLQAKEYEESVEPLRKAAQLKAEAEDPEDREGDVYLQLGHVLSTLERYGEAAEAIERGIEIGLDREDQAYLYLGMAYFHNQDFDEAEAAFRRAQRDERSRRSARGWLRYITAEKRRLKRLADAGVEPGSGIGG